MRTTPREQVSRLLVLIKFHARRARLNLHYNEICYLLLRATFARTSKHSTVMGPEGAPLTSFSRPQVSPLMLKSFYISMIFAHGWEKFKCLLREGIQQRKQLQIDLGTHFMQEGTGAPNRDWRGKIRQPHCVGFQRRKASSFQRRNNIVEQMLKLITEDSSTDAVRRLFTPGRRGYNCKRSRVAHEHLNCFEHKPIT